MANKRKWTLPLDSAIRDTQEASPPHTRTRMDDAAGAVHNAGGEAAEQQEHESTARDAALDLPGPQPVRHRPLRMQTLVDTTIDAAEVAEREHDLYDSPPELGSDDDEVTTAVPNVISHGLEVPPVSAPALRWRRSLASLAGAHTIDQYRPPKRRRPAHPRRPLTPVPGSAPKPALGDRLRQAADHISKHSFKYHPIGADEVRLLKLEKGGPKDDIKAGLLTVPFHKLGQTVIFEALSYHWGEDAAAKPIFVRDLTAPQSHFMHMYQGVDHLRRKEFRVKDNLYKALYHLRDPTQDLWLWIDALCINQDDPKEKESQVARIADVYICAKSVIIWLGESDDHTERAMTLLEELADPKKQSNIIDDPTRLISWKDLTHLMKSTWFSRRWVIQELALAQDAVVFCGADSIHWNDLRDGISIFVQNEECLRENFQKSNMWKNDYHALDDPESLAAKVLVERAGEIFRKNARWRNLVATQSLEVLVSSLFAFDTSDPRDTINGLINISKEGVGLAERYKAALDQRPSYQRQDTVTQEDLQTEYRRIAQVWQLGTSAPPLPSYQRDVLDVYVDFLKWIVEKTGNINILCRHWAIPERTRPVSGYPDLVRLPSWIKLTTNGPFTRIQQTWCRQNADSLVGLPDECPYSACSTQNKADITFTIHQAHELATRAHVPIEFRKSASARVKGLRIGSVNQCTDAVSGGNITQSALNMLGWKRDHGIDDYELNDDIWRPLVADRGVDGRNPPPLWRKSCTEILSNYTDNQSINVELILPKVDKTHTKSFLKRMRQVTWNRKFMELRLDKVYENAAYTPNHAIGLGQPDTREGDDVCILYGCSVPCILRPRQNRDGPGLEYEFIGECYVYGFMGGEAIDILHPGELQQQEAFFNLV